MPTAAPAHPAPTTTRITRDELIRLGQAGRPWDFLPLGVQAVAALPRDAGLRFLLAANFAKLGLVTLAREHLRLLPDGAAADPGVAALIRAVAALPSDALPASDRIETCRCNIGALRERAIDLSDAFVPWSAKAADWDCFRALDGNIVRRAVGSASEFIGLGDVVGAIDRFAATHLAPGRKDAGRPHTVEGIDPPWLLLKLVAATPRQKDGYGTPITVVQADPGELLDGLSLSDLRHVIADERIRFFIGPDAAERLAADLRTRSETQLVGPYIPLVTLRARATPGIDRVTARAEADQIAEHDRLSAHVRSIYAARDRAWWNRRYEEALGSGSGDPLRILIPTCRYSTFIKHSSADLAEAFRARGCRAEILIEPDNHSRLASPAYLRRFAEFQPDLVVLINYTRSHMNGLDGKPGAELIPGGVPFVCWLQDSMPHQFDERAGARQTDLDFLVGHLHKELFTRCGYPKARTLSMPVVASETKFHAGPVAPQVKARHACEIAFISHHSETPQAMHARLVREAGAQTPVRRVFDALLPRVEHECADLMTTSLTVRLTAAVSEEVERAFGRDLEAGPRLRSVIWNQYALPMADRVARHQVLGWAAEIGARRGWRLHLYGRGWDGHPTLGAFAKGEIEHGEELRAAYQSAAVHLHASVCVLMHQRVMECALSGGLPLCLLGLDELSVLRGWAQRAASAREAPTVCDLETRRTGHMIADHPECMAFTGLLQRLGRPCERICSVGPERRASLLADRSVMVLERQAAWLLGDLAETTFWSSDTLEARVDRAIRLPRWREASSAAMAGRVGERLTYRVLAGRMVEMVRESLGAAGNTP